MQKYKRQRLSLSSKYSEQIAQYRKKAVTDRQFFTAYPDNGVFGSSVSSAMAPFSLLLTEPTIEIFPN